MIKEVADESSSPVTLDAEVIQSLTNIDFKTSPTRAIRMRITQDGRVGIGTTNPDKEIYGQRPMLAVTGYASLNGLRVGLDGVNDILTDSSSGLTVTSVSTDENATVDFKTGGYETKNIRMRITKNGNVGIGTTNPQAKLEVQAPHGDWMFLRQQRNVEGGGFHIHNPLGNSDQPQGDLSRNRLEIGYKTDDGEDLWEQIVLHGPTGNVGIGTGTPAAKLHVAGDELIQGPYGFDEYGEEASLYLGGESHYIKAKHGTGVQIGTWHAPDAVTIRQHSGKVGIGTTSPKAKLDVAGDFRISDVSGNGSIIFTLPPTQDPAKDRAIIQTAIDSLPSDGGTVFLQRGQYVVGKAGEKADYAIAMRAGVILRGSSAGPNGEDVTDGGTCIHVDEPSRSIAAIEITSGAWPRSGITIKDILFTHAQSQDGKRHTAINLYETSMASVENIVVKNYLVGIHVSHWVNHIRNCQFWKCGIGIQLSGKPFVKKVVITDSGISPQLHAVVDDPNKICVGMHLWNAKNDRRWLITGVSKNDLSLEYLGERNTYPSDPAEAPKKEADAGIYFKEYDVPDHQSSGATVTTVLSCHCAGCSNYGIYIRGLQNALLNTTVEVCNVTDESVGVYVENGSYATSITNCYFEFNKTHIQLEKGVMGTNLVGNFVYYRPAKKEEGGLDEKWILSGAGLTQPDYSYHDFMTTKIQARKIKTDEDEEWVDYKWDTSSTLTSTELGVGLEIQGPHSDWLFLRQQRDVGGGGGFHIHNPWADSSDQVEGVTSRNRLEIAYQTPEGWNLWEQFVLHGPSGNVGIGTGNPQAKLDVNGTVLCGSVQLKEMHAKDFKVSPPPGTIIWNGEYLWVYTDYYGWSIIRIEQHGSP